MWMMRACVRRLFYFFLLSFLCFFFWFSALLCFALVTAAPERVQNNGRGGGGRKRGNTRKRKQKQFTKIMGMDVKKHARTRRKTSRLLMGGWTRDSGSGWVTCLASLFFFVFSSSICYIRPTQFSAFPPIRYRLLFFLLKPRLQTAALQIPAGLPVLLSKPRRSHSPVSLSIYTPRLTPQKSRPPDKTSSSTSSTASAQTSSSFSASAVSAVRSIPPHLVSSSTGRLGHGGRLHYREFCNPVQPKSQRRNSSS